jgi:mono/diheme cytochrome c family protein
MFPIRAIILAAAGIFSIGNVSFASPPDPVATTPPVYIPDMSHANGSLPDSVLAWDDLMKSADATTDDSQADFLFSFTNIASGNVVIVNAQASCGCTRPKLPALPWIIPPGGTGQIPITVNIAGKSGVIFKYVIVSTDKGSQRLVLRINISPAVMPTLTTEERALQMAIAKADRQAIFRGDCASCHARNVEGKYGSDLYDAVCGICHEAQNRATMVPDLHHLTVPTNDDFWRTWITYGKPGSLMAAFSTAQGGPLSDIQIASLAAYLNGTIPSHVAPPPQ